MTITRLLGREAGGRPGSWRPPGPCWSLKMPKLIAMAQHAAAVRSARVRQGHVVGERLLAHLLALWRRSPWRSAFSRANVMLGPLEVCAMFLAMKFSLFCEPVHVSGVGGLDAFLVDVGGPLHRPVCIVGSLDRLVLAVLGGPADAVEYMRLCMTP